MDHYLRHPSEEDAGNHRNGTSRRSLFRQLCLLLLLVACPSLHAQPQNMAFKYISNDVGLAVAGHHCIVQDSRGFIWFGDDDGLYRYDGYELKAYRHDSRDETSIGAGAVNWICVDRSGALWVAVGDGGLDRFNRMTGHFTHYRNIPSDSTSLSNNSVHAIIESHDGILWTGSLNGADEFNPEQPVFKHHRHDPRDTGSLSHHDVSTIYEDRSGTLWLGTWGGGLNEYDRQLARFRHYRHKDSDPSSLSDDKVHSICETSDGMLWVGTWGGGLDMFDRRTKHFLHFRHEPGSPHSLSDNSITSILQTSDGRLWVGTWSGGLNLFDQRTGTFRSYRYDPLLRNSLCDNKVTSLCEDRSGILWIGTRGGVNFLNTRIERFAHQKTKPPDVRTTVNDFVSSIIRDKAGRLWIGTLGGGVDRFDFGARAYKHFAHSARDPGSLADDAVTSICQDPSGTIWIATSISVDRLEKDDQHFTHYLSDPADSNTLGDDGIAALAADPAGVLWIGLNMSGVDEYDAAERHFIHHRHSAAEPYSLNDDMVRTVHIDRQGTPWIGTATGGLDMYDRSNKKFVHHVHDPENPASLNSNDIRAVYEDKSGGFWVRTEKGLDRMDRNTGMCVHYTTGDEAPPHFCSSLEEDSQANLWYSTKTGIVKVNPRTAAKRLYGLPDDLEFDKFQDLLQGSTTGQQRLFLGSLRGLLAFSPDSIRDNVVVPPVVITSFTLAGEDLLPHSDVAEKEELLLAAGANAFSFEFAALDFAEPQKNQYAYKLEGFDRDWIACGTRRYARYTNLDGGDYIFRVKGSNSDGVWNEAGASIRISIKPPYWQTWWFRAGTWVLLSLIVFGGVRFVEITRLRRRLRALEQVQALERERLRISQDMHDEVGATLTEIAILSELAKSHVERSLEAKEHMNRISEKSRAVIDNIGEIIWAINPKNDPLENLVAYLHRYAVDYFKSSPINCRIEIPGLLPPVQLTSESRRGIFLVVKEALHNVVKHSGASEVVLRLEVSNQVIAIAIEDNGKGFPLHEGTREGMGLHSMEKRAEDIGGTIEFESNQPSGTKISLRVPTGGAEEKNRRMA